MLDAEAGTHEHESHFLREALAWLAGMNEPQLATELSKYSASTFHYWLDELERHLQQCEHLLGLDEESLAKALGESSESEAEFLLWCNILEEHLTEH